MFEHLRYARIVHNPHPSANVAVVSPHAVPGGFDTFKLRFLRVCQNIQQAKMPSSQPTPKANPPRLAPRTANIAAVCKLKYPIYHIAIDGRLSRTYIPSGTLNRLARYVTKKLKIDPATSQIAPPVRRSL